MSEGGCRCGAVRFEADGAPLVTMACHCRGCQQMSASALSLSSLYEAKSFRVAKGETVRGGLKSGPNHQFCPSCMSWLFTVPEGMEAFVNVRSSLFDDAGEHRPFMETWKSEGLDFAQTGSPRSYESVPQDSEFDELIQAYAAWDGRVKA